MRRKDQGEGGVGLMMECCSGLKEVRFKPKLKQKLVESGKLESEITFFLKDDFIAV